jgi:trk system potassium uptake protein TrkA
LASRGRAAFGDGTGVVVIGLGRFGSAVARSLIKLGHEVLALDEDESLVQKYSDELTHVVQADATDSDVLRQLGVHEFDNAVVGIGTDIEASVLTVLALDEIGVKQIWAKAITAKHGHILERVGADHVVFPEAAMGERVAHLVNGKMLDFIAFDDGFAIAKVCAPRDLAGKTLAEAKLRTRFNITVVGIKRAGEDFIRGVPEVQVERGDLLIVSGPSELVERFAAST